MVNNSKNEKSESMNSYVKITEAILKKVISYSEEKEMFRKGEPVVVGVSGGADSVCLLLMLLEIRKRLDIDIHVVHINHMIRTDAMEDADYVKSLCEKYQVSFRLVCADVERLAKEQHISTEEAGRNVRYEAFYEELSSCERYDKEAGFGRIAIAHNKNDCCETFLFNLFRGSSLKGLGGIQPVRDCIVRPLLCLDRPSIEQYLELQGIKYCIDSTNLEDNYTRNKIRHHILGTAIESISPRAVEHIGAACEHINDAYSLIEELTREAFEASITYDETRNVYCLNKEHFDDVRQILKSYVLMELIAVAAGKRKDIDSIHVRQTYELLSKQSGKSVNLPYGLIAVRTYDGIEISKKVPEVVKKEDKEVLVLDREYLREHLEGTENLCDGYKKHEIQTIWNNEKKICLRLKMNFDLQNIPQNKYTKWFDYDKIRGDIAFRTRCSGDYLTMDPGNRRKSIKAFFIDNKIPSSQREDMCLMTEKDHVIWVLGDRISSYYKVGVDTRRILEVEVIE